MRPLLHGVGTCPWAVLAPLRYIQVRMKNESQVVVRPARGVRGSVRLPGDKSISHRYAMLAGIAEGPSRLENYSTGADCASTLGCMRALGVAWERKSEDGANNVIEVQGHGLGVGRARRSARLRQLGFDHAHAERHCGRTKIRQ